MIYKCPHCDGALEYNPKHGKMKCPYCGSHIRMQELKVEDYKLQKDDASEIHINDGETMSCKIYTCTTCAGELAVNDVEASTFCPYCGQPTIVFSRISQELKPRYIVPFKITKEQAIFNIRQRVSKSRFAPDDVRKFDIERIRGIYVPYWLFDLDFYDNIKFDGYTGSKNKSYWVYTREAACSYNGITLDASKNLNDELSIRLEPYDLTQVVPFEPGYLSGFYTDKFDVEEEQLVDAAVKRAMGFFDEEVRKSVEGTITGIRERNPQYCIKRTEYALLPAWFLTFRHKNVPYTLIVNGQTGKVVGSIPVDEEKMKKYFIGKAAMMFGIYAVFNVFFLAGGMYMSGFLTLIMSLVFYAVGRSKYRNYKQKLELAKEANINRYVKERQERT